MLQKIIIERYSIEKLFPIRENFWPMIGRAPMFNNHYGAILPYPMTYASSGRDQ